MGRSLFMAVWHSFFRLPQRVWICGFVTLGAFRSGFMCFGTCRLTCTIPATGREKSWSVFLTPTNAFWRPKCLHSCYHKWIPFFFKKQCNILSWPHPSFIKSYQRRTEANSAKKFLPCGGFRFCSHECFFWFCGLIMFDPSHVETAPAALDLASLLDRQWISMVEADCNVGCWAGKCCHVAVYC